jgi:hypothetical protein
MVARQVRTFTMSRTGSQRWVVLLVFLAVLVALVSASGAPALAGDHRRPGSTIYQWAVDTGASVDWSSGDAWAVFQATGKPDTFACGDLTSAWAPGPDGADAEWLEVEFSQPVHATGIEVYETHIGGFVTEIEVVDVRGRAKTVWRGDDTTPCPGVLSASFGPTARLIDRVRVHTQIEGWEEIDTVKLIGLDGASVVEQWPTAATASSSYAESWAPMQAEGPPDTAVCNPFDFGTGTYWEANGDADWLDVFYRTPVHANEVRIYEVQDSGIVYQVDLIDTEGTYHTVWTGEDTTPCPGPLSVKFDTTRFPVVGARIHTDGSGGLVGIDAVALIGRR